VVAEWKTSDFFTRILSPIYKDGRYVEEITKRDETH
jgi:hypothetical protein